VRTRAAATLTRSPDSVYAFLADLENHWQLASTFVSLDAVRDDEGGWITVRGPFGISRRARTSLVRCDPPAGGTEARVEGIARVESGTIARVTWRVAAAGGGSRVALETALEHPSRADRVLLALGGRLWLRRCLARTLAQLESAVS
jgi:carbon monoxide dehydrogenase subunit G